MEKARNALWGKTVTMDGVNAQNIENELSMFYMK